MVVHFAITMVMLVPIVAGTMTVIVIMFVIIVVIEMTI